MLRSVKPSELKQGGVAGRPHVHTAPPGMRLPGGLRPARGALLGVMLGACLWAVIAAAAARWLS